MSCSVASADVSPIADPAGPVHQSTANRGGARPAAVFLTRLAMANDKRLVSPRQPDAPRSVRLNNEPQRSYGSIRPAGVGPQSPQQKHKRGPGTEGRPEPCCPPKPVPKRTNSSLSL